MSSPGWTDKIVLLIPRLASDSDGEVLATVAAIRRVLKSNGGDLHDLAKAIGSPQAQRGSSMHDDMRDAQSRAKEAYQNARWEGTWEANRRARDEREAHNRRMREEYERRFGQGQSYTDPYDGVNFEEVVTFCNKNWVSMSPREIEFVGSVQVWMQSRGRPTDKQIAWLMSIYDRIRRNQ